MIITRPILAGILLAAAAPAFAGTIITMNLNGVGNVSGTPITHSLAPYPGPGGLTSVLTYNLPFAGTQGDVLLFDPNLGFPGDLLRFNGNDTLAVYADDLNGLNSLAATPNPPASLYPNSLVIDETGPEGNLMATYTPVAGDPGYDSSSPTYILNASTVPEPDTLPLTAFALACVAIAAVRRNKTRAA